MQAHSPPRSVLRPADIVTEIHRLAAQRQWSQAELARRLGVNRSVLVHARGGRRPLTTPVLARVARLFADVPIMKELLYSYLRYEHPVGSEELGVLPRSTEPSAPGLPPKARAVIRRYVHTFPSRLVDGRGLLIRGDTAKALTAAADYVTSALTRAGVSVARRNALDAVGPTEAERLNRVRLVVIDRADSGGLPGKLLVASCLASERPIVVTTAADLPPILGDKLARELAARCTVVVVDTPPVLAQ